MGFLFIFPFFARRNPENKRMLADAFGGIPMKNMIQKLNLSKQQLIIAGGVAVAVLAALLALLLWPGNVREELTVEAGAHTLEAAAFLKEDKGEPISFVTDMSTIDLSVPATHEIQLSYKDKVETATLIIEDTIAPEAVVQNVSVYSNQELTADDFIVSVSDATEVTVALKEQPDLTKEGSRLVNVVLTDLGGNTAEYEAVLTVFIDNGVPQLSGVAPVFTYIGKEPNYLKNVTAMDDTDMAMEILVDTSKVDLNTVGTYDIVYSVTDAAGNTTTAPSTLTVTDDNTPPTILGVKNISAYLGTAVSYRSGIEVRDDRDAAPTLEIISSEVDLSNPGTYPLIYIARDMTGNETRVEVTVTIAEKPETFVDEETINAKADELLKRIVTDDMTDDAKVRAIYAYVRSHFTYSGHSDKTDWLQGAYVMMHEGEGDCFNYYAVTKLFLERLGIPNIDVVKVKNHDEDSEHFWSLVSVDGGQSYYHLDTTPRVGDGDDFCLVTDAFLDAYSDANKKCHNRDKSLYPATPAE